MNFVRGFMAFLFYQLLLAKFCNQILTPLLSNIYTNMIIKLIYYL